MTESAPLARPVPVPDEITAAYWAGAREGRLMITRCSQCRKYVHPPQATCPHCQGESLVPDEVSGMGQVYSFSVMHLPGVPGFEPPFAVAVVELVEQEGLLTVGNVLDCDPAELAIGLPVKVTYEAVSESISLPQWRRAAS